MKFSELEDITFTIKRFSFDKISPEVLKFDTETKKMSFKEGKALFLNLEWKGKEIQENQITILYLLSFIDKKIFRIKLICLNGNDFQKDFISGEIRVYEDGDFWIEAVLLLQDYHVAQKEFEFGGVDKNFEVLIPNSNHLQKKKFWSKDKNYLTKGDDQSWTKDEVYSWTKDEVHSWLKKIIDEDEANILLHERIDGPTFIELTDDDLKNLNLSM
jgi:hypothetical protein